MRGRVAKEAVLTRMRTSSLPALSLPALVLLAVVMLAGCGGGATSTSTPSSSTAPNASPSAAHEASSAHAVATHPLAPSGSAVAFVARTPISKSSYAHWQTVERALGAKGSTSHQTLGFLITSAWVLAEAASQGVSVSSAEVNSRLTQLEHQSFPQAGSLQKFLARSHETEADLLKRVRVELLESRIAAKITAGKSATQRKTILASYQLTFQRRWKSRTTCETGYLMEDCSEYRGAPEHLATNASSNSSTASGSTHSSGSPSAHSGSSSSSGSPSTGSGSSASGSAGSGSSASSSANATGEVYSSPGSMSISSSAFERNGAIPSQYTCDGANITPPLEWQNVPAKAATLVLFIIDDTSTGPASGIRWVVGDISPTAKGVAAGKTPEGGIVGSDTQGQSGYGGICPPHGKTSTIEFVLYALSKKIPLSPGFLPSVAEREYGAGNDLLGEAATTYAVYHRP
jgi:Raf kinase inhibitor-like YbhB/YbcL family protein